MILDQELANKHIEISIFKNKFYILICDFTAGGRQKPQLIEMFIKQARNLFNYCEKSFNILLDLIKVENGKFIIIDFNKIIGNDNQ